jgi:DNA uptake protein ComE-like DNA-binding protein
VDLGKGLEDAVSAFRRTCAYRFLVGVGSSIGIVAFATVSTFNVSAEAQQAPSAFVMPDTPGRDTFESVCSLCHAPVAVVGKHFTKDQWEAKVSEMLQEEPDVTAQERVAIVGYLSANFNPGGKIYVNVASAKDLAVALEISLDEATTLVRHRQMHGSFKSMDDLKGLGIDASKIEAKKDRLAF